MHTKLRDQQEEIQTFIVSYDKNVQTDIGLQHEIFCSTFSTQSTPVQDKEIQTDQRVVPLAELETTHAYFSIELEKLKQSLEREKREKLLLEKELAYHKVSLNSISTYHLTESQLNVTPKSITTLFAGGQITSEVQENYDFIVTSEIGTQTEDTEEQQYLRKILMFPQKIIKQEGTQTFISHSEFEILKKSTLNTMKIILENSIIQDSCDRKQKAKSCNELLVSQDVINQFASNSKRHITSISQNQTQMKKKRLSFINALDYICSSNSESTLNSDAEETTPPDKYDITCNTTGNKISKADVDEYIGKNYEKKLINEKQELYVCTHQHNCGTTHVNKSSVSSHIFSIDFKVKCNNCNKIYNRFTNYTQHVNKTKCNRQ